MAKVRGRRQPHPRPTPIVRPRGPGSDGVPPNINSRAVREYLAVLDDAAFGAATLVVPKYLAPADPASRWTSAHRGPAFYAYSTNYLIDLDHAVIMDVEASTAVRQAEVTACKRMIARVHDRFGVWPTSGRRHRLRLGRDACLARP